MKLFVSVRQMSPGVLFWIQYVVPRQEYYKKSIIVSFGGSTAWFYLPLVLRAQPSHAPHSKPTYGTWKLHSMGDTVAAIRNNQL